MTYIKQIDKNKRTGLKNEIICNERVDQQELNKLIRQI